MIKDIMKCRSRKKIILDVLVYMILILGSIIMIGPFAWMLSTSLKSVDATFIMPPQWIPKDITFINYQKVTEVFPMYKFLANSIFVSVSSTLGQLLFCSMAAYAFARMEFKGRDALFLLYLGTLMVPSQVTLTPLFILMKKLDLANTYRALILPGMFSAFGTFLMRQFFLTIPKSLEEAAFIDGAGYIRVFFKIILPLSKTALATLGIFSFMASWNDFLWPLIITSDIGHMTLPLGLSSLQGRWTTNWNILMAGTLISIVPILIVYIFAQKYFIKGITLTGIKG
jgi:multiple sugar transport system permease protein